MRATAGLIAGLALAAPALGQDAPADGAAVFARCAACHLPDGAGVPGAFPALRGQVGRFAAGPGGRDYLVSVVSHGLTGPLQANGAAYAGFMPAQSLTDAEAAAVLNHLLTVIAPAPAARAFTAAEVAARRAGREGASAQDSRALRPDALAATP